MIEHLIKIGGMIFGKKYYCFFCGKEIKGFKDRLSAKEYKISKTCQSCQDKVFYED
jgi:DNA-directed RNA polymerase subunit RPC12/RpoP